MSQLTASVQRIPPEKRRPKLVKTLIGGLIFAGGFLLPKYLGFPWQVGVAVAFFGGFIASQELIVAYAKILPAAVGALVRALTGKNGDAAP